MYENSEDSSRYYSSPAGAGYTDPRYYQQDGIGEQDSPFILSPESSYPVPYSDYGIYQPEISYRDIVPTEVPVLPTEYRGPQQLHEYTAGENADTASTPEGGAKRKKRGLAKLGGLGAALAALLLKLQSLAFLLKFGLAGITALISVGVYAFFLGWPFAIGLVLLLFIHEMGHALVMKLKGIPMGGLIFVPMLGAAVTMRRMPQNARDEAEVGIAGPIAGTLAASACLLLAQMHTSAQALWASLAYFGFFMNLFNLIPIVPFDGGRVLAAIDRRIWILGFVGLLAFEVWSWLQGNFSVWLLFFIIMAATQLFTRGMVPNTPQAKAYYNVPVGTRIILSLAYFGLAAVLVLGMSISHGLIPMLGTN